jgi:hypothetical protein
LKDERGRPEARSEPIDLEEFFRILPHLEMSELLAMSAAYENADPEARDAARESATGTARRRGRKDDLRNAQSAILQWAGSDISPSSLFTLERISRSDQVLGDVRRKAIPALLDAATACLLDADLEPDIAAVLRAPWSAAVPD